MKSPREWALTVKLAYCEGACAGDALLCVPHQRILQAIEGAVFEAVQQASRWTE